MKFISVIALWTLCICPLEIAAQSANAPTRMNLQAQGAPPFQEINYASGNVVRHQPLLAVKGFSVSIQYSSEGVERKAATRNVDAPTGIIGLGWSLGKNRIARHHKGTANTLDDSYYLNLGGSVYELLYIGVEEQVKSYRIAAHPDWILKFHPQYDQWEVVQDNGTRFVYGEGELNKGYKANSTEYLIHWGNWIGSSSLTKGQQRMASAWNVAIKENIKGQQLRFHYNQTLEQIGDDGKYFSKASYLDTITGYEGKKIALSYGEKDPGEFVDPHQKKNPGTSNDKDAYQERFETKFLSKLSLYNFYGEVQDVIELDYRFLNSKNPVFIKRVLTHIRYKNPLGKTAEPPTVFDYYGLDPADSLYVYSTADSTLLFHKEHGALFGALKSTRLPEGASYIYRYGKQELPHSQREINLHFPEKIRYHARAGLDTTSSWNAPELTFAGSYVIALYDPIALDCNYTHVQVYEWMGDKWKLALNETIAGLYHDNYQAFDYVRASTLDSIKTAVLKDVSDAVPVLGGVMNAFSDALKDVVQGDMRIGQDIVQGKIGQAIEDYFMKDVKLIEDVAQDIGVALENTYKEMKKGFDEITQNKQAEYQDDQLDLYTKKRDFEVDNPRREYHLTAKKNFFALCSNLDSVFHIFQKDPAVEGKWLELTFPMMTSSKYFQIQSGENFIAILDELLDIVYIFSWDGLDWRRNVITLNMDRALGEEVKTQTDTLLANHANSLSSMACQNNFILTIMKEQGLMGEMKATFIFHDENMNWKVRSELVQDTLAISGFSKEIMGAFFGQGGKMVVKSGPSFAAIQTYNHFNSEFPTIKDIPVIGDFVDDFVPDFRKFNATYGLSWDEDFSHINVQFLHAGIAQTDISIQINGDVINKVGKAHSLIVGSDNKIAPDDGKNYAFRYTGELFLKKQLPSEYVATAFGEDISSTVRTDGASAKTPKFHQFDPNWIPLDPIPQASTAQLEQSLLGYKNLGKAADSTSVKSYISSKLMPAILATNHLDSVGWSLIAAASQEDVPTAAELDEITNVTVEGINMIAMVVAMVIPGLGEAMELGEEAMSAIETAENAANVVSNATMVLQSFAMDIIDAIISPDPFGTSLRDNYISVNGKLFTKQADESWIRLTDSAYEDTNGTLVETSNKLLPGYYPFTLKKGEITTNAVVLLKNGTRYKKIELDSDAYRDMVVHEDSLSQVAGYGAFVSYGPLDTVPDKIGFVMPNEARAPFLPEPENEEERKRHAPYRDATKVRLHRVIQDEVSGKLTDYVLKSVEIDDGYNSYAHNYLYESGQYSASSGNAIYGRVIDVTSPEPISDLNTANLNTLAKAGYTEHFFYNRYNYYAQDTAVGYPGVLKFPFADSLVKFQSYYPQDKSDFRDSAAKALFASPWLTNTYEAGKRDPVDQQLTHYKLWELDLHHPLDSNALDETQIYVVKPIRSINIRDGVIKKVEQTYDEFPVRLRKNIRYATSQDGVTERYTTQFTYASELLGDLAARNRKTEIKNATLYYQKGTDPIVKLGGKAIAYADTLQYLSLATYQAKHADALNLKNFKDYALSADEDVEKQDSLIGIYEDWLYKLEIAKGDFSKAREAADAAHQAAVDGYLQLATIAQELPEIKKSDTSYHKQLIEAYRHIDSITQKILDERTSLEALNAKERVFSSVTQTISIEDINIEIDDRKTARDVAIAGCVFGPICLAWVLPLSNEITDKEKTRDNLIKLEVQGSILQMEIQTKKGELAKHVADSTKWDSTIRDRQSRIQEEDSLLKANQGMLQIKKRLSYIKASWAKVTESSQNAISDGDHTTVLKTGKHEKVNLKLDQLVEEHKNLQNQLDSFQINTPSSFYLHPDQSITPFVDSSSKVGLNQFFNKLTDLGDRHDQMVQGRISIQNELKEKHQFSAIRDAAKWVEEKRILRRDSLNGNVISWENAKNATTSVLLDKYHRNVVMHIQNADVNTQEVFHTHFEPNADYSGKAARRIRTKYAHTGEASVKAGWILKIDFPDFMPKKEVYLQDSLYVLSAWVKRRAPWYGGGIYVYQGDSLLEELHIPYDKGWQYYEKVIPQPHPERGKIWMSTHWLHVDNVLLRPLHSIAQSFTYTRNDQLSSEVSNNGLVIRHMYDSHQRQILSVDDEGRVRYFTHHGFSASDSEGFDPANPNSSLSIQFQGKGNLLTKKRKGFVHKEIHPAREEYVLSFSMATQGAPFFDIELNEADLHYASGTLTFNGQVIIQNLPHPENWAFIKTGGYLLVYGDGHLLGQQNIQLNTDKEKGIIVVQGQGLSYVFAGLDPIVSQRYLDGMGREIQRLQLEYDEDGRLIGKAVAESLYDGWGNPLAQTLTAFVPKTDLHYEADFVKSFDLASGKLEGDIVDYIQQSEIEGLLPEDGHYAYHGFQYASSPLHRSTHNIPPGAFFHQQPSNQQTLAYQDKNGRALFEKIGIPEADSTQFSNQTTIDPNQNKQVSLHDGLGQLVATQQGNSIAQLEHHFKQDTLASIIRFPNHFTNTGLAPKDSQLSFTQILEKRDLLGLYDMQHNGDEGSMITIRDHMGMPVFHIRNRAHLKRDTSESWHTIEYFKYDQLGRHVEEGVDSTQYHFALLEIMANAGFWDDEHIRAYRNWTYDMDEEGSTRNLLGRLVQSVHHQGDHRVSESYTYNLHGQTSTINQEITGLQQGNIRQQISYTYLPDGKLNSITYPGGQLVQYTYDKRGRMQGVGTPDQPFQYARYAYTIDGLLKETQLNNGSLQKLQTYTLQRIPATQGYQQNGRILFQQKLESNNHPGQPPYLMGMIQSIHESGQLLNTERKRSFTYDDQYRLTKVDESAGSDTHSYSYTYDGNGNLNSFTAPSGKKAGFIYKDGQNIRQEMASTNGLLNSIQDTDFHLDTILYDLYTSMPLKVVPDAAAGSYTTFGYDAHNQRVFKQSVSGSNTESTIYFRGDHSLPLRELHYSSDQAGSPANSRNLIYGLGYAPISSVEEENNSYYHLRDYQGSLRYAVDQNNAQVAAFDYTPFGELITPDQPRGSEDPSKRFSYLYTGQEYDSELGLYNYRARLYSPTEKIFLAPDPLREYASPYTYVANNPVNYVDHTGEGEIVYRLIDTDLETGHQVIYYGITERTAHERMMEHWRGSNTVPSKAFDRMEVIAKDLTHDEARTIEGALIRRRLGERVGIRDGVVQKDLNDSGLLNKDRGRKPERWHPEGEGKQVLADPLGDDTFVNKLKSSGKISLDDDDPVLETLTPPKMEAYHQNQGSKTSKKRIQNPKDEQDFGFKNKGRKTLNPEKNQRVFKEVVE